jgi:sulfite reductase (NADPH) flavoprotein alpha-component
MICRIILHERRVLGHKGGNWLFFGERSSSSDFLYREELDGMLANGHLTGLIPLFRGTRQTRYICRIA